MGVLGPRLPITNPHSAFSVQARATHLGVLYRAQQSLWDLGAPATTGPGASSYLTDG